uniref:Uncharacterized protein n=1 Tax=Phlebotomus papatasi TaxID=29031 RepID=A0A1B0DII3_PHLPP
MRSKASNPHRDAQEGRSILQFQWHSTPGKASHPKSRRTAFEKGQKREESEKVQEKQETEEEKILRFLRFKLRK